MKRILVFIFLIPSVYSSTKVMVISDLNSSYGSMDYHSAVKKSIDAVAIHSPDLVISTGDMIAGQKAGLDYKGMWDSFHEIVTRPLLLLRIPFAITPGNHDGSGALAFKLEREEFVSQWQHYRPNLNFVDNAHFPNYYAFVVKDILFVSLDATLVGKLPFDQKKWLERVLITNSFIKYKVVFGHLPIFPVADQKSHEFMDDVELRNLLKMYRVDLFLSGHHHAYYPGVSDGIRQISQGCLGSGPRRIIGEQAISERSYTVIEFDEKNGISVEAFKSGDSSERIPRDSLPKEIHYQGKVMVRDDIFYED